MEALAIPETRERLRGSVDALVVESIEGFTTSELGADIIEISIAIDRLEAERLRRVHLFHRDHGVLAATLLRHDGESRRVSRPPGADPR
jgi:hypothetical protein